MSAAILTPEAVHAVLTRAGFEAAEIGEDDYRPVTEGFHAFPLPVTHEDRVAVFWNSSSFGEAWIHEPEPHLAACATVLEAEGYKTEFVADVPAGYLAVWIEGEF